MSYSSLGGDFGDEILRQNIFYYVCVFVSCLPEYQL